jgi:hypothetical protein
MLALFQKQQDLGVLGCEFLRQNLWQRGHLFFLPLPLPVLLQDLLHPHPLPVVTLLHLLLHNFHPSDDLLLDEAAITDFL